MQEETTEKTAEEEMTGNGAAENEAAGNGAAEEEMTGNGAAGNEAAGNKTAETEGIQNIAAGVGADQTGADAGKMTGTKDDSAKRGAFLKGVAGLYLIYTAYELANSYLKNEEGSSLGFCVAGIVFGIIGVFLLYIVIRDYLRENKR